MTQAAAKKRVTGWFNDPAHSPSPADDEMTRTGSITDPALQQPDPDEDDGTTEGDDE